MKKKFKLTDLDCANCAMKIEDAITKIDGIENVSVVFATKKKHSIYNVRNKENINVHDSCSRYL